MRKILLSACMLAMSSGLFAQIQKGAMALTGIIGFNGGHNVTEQTSTQTNVTVTTFDQKTRGRTIMPAFSYFVTDMIEAGVFVALVKNSSTRDFHPMPNALPSDPSTSETENPLTAFGVFGNYYLKTSGAFNWYAGAQFGTGSGTAKTTNTPVSGNATVNETDNKISTFGLNTGFLFFVKNNLSLNINFGLLSFNTIKTENTSNGFKNETKNSTWNFGVNGVIVNVGLKLFFGNAGGPPPPPAPAPAP